MKEVPPAAPNCVVAPLAERMEHSHHAQEIELLIHTISALEAHDWRRAMGLLVDRKAQLEPRPPPMEPVVAAVRIQAMYRGRKARTKLMAWMNRCGMKLTAAGPAKPAVNPVMSSHQPWSGSRSSSTLGAGNVAAAVALSTTGRGAGNRVGPRMLCCYVCGTQHGLASLMIHQKQCVENRAKVQVVSHCTLHFAL